MQDGVDSMVRAQTDCLWTPGMQDGGDSMVRAQAGP